MLQRLHIKNFILIEELTIEFGEGLNILTGETGAGKSILIGAISGILGAKLSADQIRSGCDRAILEGSFEIEKLPHINELLDNFGLESDDDFLQIRREIYASGKGRCFINASQVPIAKLKELSDYLLVIHGQHEHVTMAKTSTHRELLDSYAENENERMLVSSLYRELFDLKEKINSAEMDEQERNRRIEFLKFALQEIDDAALQANEEENLKEESTLLANSEKLFAEINRSMEIMKGEAGVISRLESVEQSLSSISEIDTNIAGELDNLRNALYTLEDTSTFLRNYEESIDFSPERLNEIEERLALISHLKKKYGSTVDEILNYAQECRNELEAIENLDYEREKLHEIYKETIEKTKSAALALSDTRINAGKELEEKVMHELADLNMKGTMFCIAIEQDINDAGEIEHGGKTYSLYPHGLDKIEFMLAANQGEALTPLRKAASGGEMSRIMLAIKKVLLSRDIVDSLVFDEVDTGISGKTAEQVGQKLKSLSRERQVFVITHLPQIAAMSDHHYTVQKSVEQNRTRTVVTHLDRYEKTREIARLLAGDKVTDTTLKQAEELIDS